MSQSSLEQIRKKLGHFTLKWQPEVWLNTNVPELNEVLGHREHGIAFGNVVEVAGWESQGKTALALVLAALAQKQGAAILWGDFERSFDPNWARARGLDADSVLLFRPYVGRFGKERGERLSTAQEICAEIEAGVGMQRRSPCMVVVDSVPAMLPEGEAEAGLEGANMRTNMDLPMFVGRLLRRWVAMAQARNVLIVLVNQLRKSPDPFNPVYTPAGNAIRFYAHSRVRMRRSKGGYIRDKGRILGVQGIIENWKNKSGSPERAKIGFKLFYNGPLKFLDADKLERSE